MKWLAYFGGLNAAFFAAVVVVVWLVGGFDGNTVDTGGTIIMALGAIICVALATALMGLIFYSDRADVDQVVFRAAEVDEAPPDEQKPAPPPQVGHGAR